MTEKRIPQEDLSKALQTLQDLAKGHSSGGTATTKVETMVGESGSPQLFHTPSDSDPGGWAGSTWRGEGWEDSIEANGTDMGAMSKLGKSIAAGIMSKLTKGQELSAREVGFVSKGGLNFLKKDDKDEDAKDDKDVKKAHGDEKDDKKLVKDMVKPDAMKSDVQKSFLEHAAETAVVSQGFEVSEFLAGFAQVMHKSLSGMEQRITDRVLTAVASSAAEQNSVQKSMAEALGSLGEVLSIHGQRLDQVESAPVRGPKSTVVAKSLEGQDGGGETLSKSQIDARLFELLQKSQVTQNDVLKFDATGEMSPDVARKVLGR